MKKGPKPRPPLERFFAKIEAEPWAGGCWIFTGYIDRDGYGKFGGGTGFSKFAHKWAYQTFIGPVPEGFQLDHFACDRPACANPWHVRPVTPLENTLRSRNEQAARRTWTHCLHGHAFDAKNTYYEFGNGTRHCRRCDAIRHAERRERARSLLPSAEDVLEP